MRLETTFALFKLLNQLKPVIADGNAFTAPMPDTTIHAGQSMELTWVEPVGSTIDLTLMSGDPSNLNTVSTIASGAPNEGTYYWKVDPSVPPGKYSIKIATDAGDLNFSPWFTVYDAVSPVPYAQKKHSSGNGKKKNNPKGRRYFGLF